MKDTITVTLKNGNELRAPIAGLVVGNIEFPRPMDPAVIWWVRGGEEITVRETQAEVQALIAAAIAEPAPGAAIVERLDELIRLHKAGAAWRAKTASLFAGAIDEIGIMLAGSMGAVEKVLDTPPPE